LTSVPAVSRASNLKVAILCLVGTLPKNTVDRIQ
jgi:hypothetical protein